MPRIWQIAGGPGERSYAAVFLRYGVGLIGPGDAGPWRLDRPYADFGGTRSVEWFAWRAKPGDIVLLRVGKSVVKAVGLIASDYLYLTQFDDVHGWDLQHGRRIRWRPLPEDHDFGQAVFGARPGRFGNVEHEQVVNFAMRFVNSPPADWQRAALPALPSEEPSLIDVPDSLRDLVGFALDFDHQPIGDRVSEDEMIVHLIVPFLRALGWLPELIAVKWRYVDVALFDRLPRRPENCRLVIEAKPPEKGAESALGQGKGYCHKLGICRDVLVSDGFRYRLYAADHDYQPVAYANLLRLKRPALDLFDRLKCP